MHSAKLIFSALLMSSASVAFAAGTESDTPPETTSTTTECTDGQILDEAKDACVDADQQSFNDDTRYDAVRELAYAGEYDRATAVIAVADNPEDPRFLNYRGFIARKTGNTDAAMGYYQAALAQAPDYHLARSYMGQGLAATGDLDGAKVQLGEIAARGGKNTWSYFALKQAIVSGTQSDY